MELSEQVDWYYVLREFWSIYRFNSAGGSKPIRSHKREVRNLISEEMEQNPEVRQRDQAELPACQWLGRALDQGMSGPGEDLVRSLKG